jgi:hypothetical protein
VIQRVDCVTSFRRVNNRATSTVSLVIGSASSVDKVLASADSLPRSPDKAGSPRFEADCRSDGQGHSLMTLEQRRSHAKSLACCFCCLTPIAAKSASIFIMRTSVETAESEIQLF